MPTYTFFNEKTNETFDRFMSISAKEQFLAENVDIKQVIQAPSLTTLVLRVNRMQGSVMY